MTTLTVNPIVTKGFSYSNDTYSNANLIPTKGYGFIDGIVYVKKIALKSYITKKQR